MSAARERPEGDAVLFLRLEGPLQAWGEDARWTVRDTRLEPTKSGVVGVLAACLGWGNDGADDGKIAALAESLLLGIRVDRPGTVIRDYHTVVGGVLSAEGKVKINASTKEPETVVSERYYLSDACFLVALRGGSALLDEVEAALADPAWPPFLGRKSCPPARPIYPALPDRPSRGSYATLREALEGFPYLGRGEPPETVRAVIEIPRGGAAPGVPTQRRRDVPIALSTRLFGYRYVYEISVTPPRPAVDANGSGGDGRIGKE